MVSHQDSMLAKERYKEMVESVERNRLAAGRKGGRWGTILRSSRMGSGRRARV